MSFWKALRHLKQLVSEAQYKLASRKASPKARQEENEEENTATQVLEQKDEEENAVA